jgi:hypothetical protein
MAKLRVPRCLRPFAAAALLLSALVPGGCTGGSEVPNELRGTLVDRQGNPVAGAQVALFEVNAVPGSGTAAVALARTDARGSYAFPQVPPGTYNILARESGLGSLRDSVSARGEALSLEADTLKPSGGLTGTVALQPGRDPRLAVVRVLGTDIFVNVDSTGHFRLDDLAEGKYRLQVSVYDSGYVPLYRAFAIRAAAADTLADTLRPFFTGIPGIAGLKAETLPDGSIKLTWNKVDYADMLGYGIVREPADAVVLSGNAMAYPTDTVFIDTVYSANPRPDPFGFKMEYGPNSVYAGQFPSTDTTAYRFRYRLAVYSKDGQPGRFTGYVYATAHPPKP